MDIEIISPEEGILVEIHLKNRNYIIPNQIIGILKKDGRVYPIVNTYEGKIKKICVEKGDYVTKGMILGIVMEE